MNTLRIDQNLSPTDYAALRDAAERHALQARGAAIDAFWTALGRAAAAAWPARQRKRAPARTDRCLGA